MFNIFFKLSSKERDKANSVTPTSNKDIPPKISPGNILIAETEFHEINDAALRGNHANPDILSSTKTKRVSKRIQNADLQIPLRRAKPRKRK